ncbi:MAG: penicillin-binding protein activator [Fimbriimonadaceae bacterium]|nr:penicillin-binding protein activator [Fimbriimonadaceae bacterium]
MSIKLESERMNGKFLLVVAASVVLVLGCRSERRSVATSSPAKLVLVGSIMPLTGDAASLGKPCEQGIELAIQQYNASKTVNEPEIRIVSEDDQADAAKAVSAFQKLADADGVKVIIGPLTSGGTLAVAPLANQKSVIVLSPGASAAEVTSAGDYVFRNEISESTGSSELAALTIQKLGSLKIAVLYVNNPYGASTRSPFEAKVKELGSTIVASEPFNTDATNLRSQLERARQAGADTLYVVYQDERHIKDVLRQRDELGLRARVLTTPVFADEGTIATLGKLAEGVIFGYYGSYNLNTSDLGARNFIAAYKERFKTSPSYFAAQGYDAANLIIAGLRNAHFHPSSLKESLLQLSTFKGVSGAMSFDANGDVKKEVSLKVVKGGRIVEF